MANQNPNPNDQQNQPASEPVELEHPERAQQESEHDGLDAAGQPTFAGKPLSAYEGMDEETLLKQPHVGEATARKIMRAQKKAAKK
jgi:hypothetical protein